MLLWYLPAPCANMVTMVLPTPSSEIMPKHDEDMGGTGEKNIGEQLGLVSIYSTQQPIKTHGKRTRPSDACRIFVNKIKSMLISL